MAEPNDYDRREIQAEPDLTVEESTKQAWAKRSVLTLDGGGIRGYWSLLALKKLMEYIALEELKQKEPSMHSYHPLAYLPSTTHGDSKNQNTAATCAHSSEKPIESLFYAQRYLPCHYFDFIGGSSTGGLIAIMLGRLRMTVDDCLREYERLSHRIFGSPRQFTTLRYYFIDRNKYDIEPVEAVFQDVSNRRGEVLREGEELHEFCSDTGVCQTTVVTIRSKQKAAGLVDTRYFIRSYDYFQHHHSPTTSRAPTKARRFSSREGVRGHQRGPDAALLGSRKDHNEGYAHKFPVWKVARAATAAPYYFDSLEIKTSDPEDNHFKFSDGGMGVTNNPTKAIVEHLEKHIKVPEHADYGKLQTVVSVGTARHDASQHREYKRLSQKVKGVYNQWSDPQDIHLEMESDYVDKRRDQNEYFFYYRLNPNLSNLDHLLDLDLDDWRPKTGSQPGWKTLKTIEDRFHAWFTNDTAAIKLFEDCAADLVGQRNARVHDRERWERYAHCVSYECRSCGSRTSFALRTEFCKHIRESHNIPARDVEGIADGVAKVIWRYKPRRPPSVSTRLSPRAQLRGFRRKLFGQ